MAYKVIFLDGEEGRPLKECEVCNEIERNVIEPVALFVKEEEYEKIAERIKNISDQELNNLIEKNNKLLGQSEQRCIFHCEKENEIWMENYDSNYISYKQRRNCALITNAPFSENPPFIQWRKPLVDKFWARIRAYRFAVEYGENPIPDNLKGHLNKIFVRYYLKKIYRNTNQYDLTFYNFKKIIFPEFQQIEIDDLNRALLDCGFWFENESYEFEKSLTFEDSIFLDKCDFRNLIFKGEENNFSQSIFLEYANFRKVKFVSNIKLDYVKFLNIANFWGVNFPEKEHIDFKGILSIREFDLSKSCFNSKIYFEENTFVNSVKFSDIKFDHELNIFKNSFGKLLFERCIFYNNLNFVVLTVLDEMCFKHTTVEGNFSGEGLKIKGLFKLERTKFIKTSILIFDSNYTNEKFVLNTFQGTNDIHIEIRNLKTKQFLIEDFINYSKNFIFFNLKLLGDNESRLEIKNSILNRMRFINCDFSEAENIHIEDSSLTDCEFVNVNWGEITEDRICKELFENKSEKAQDIYRQLKLAHDNQKDFIHGNDFYALEMRAYERYLSNGNKEKEGKKKKKNIKLQDKIVFKIAKIASNYAQDWVRPLLWIITFCIEISCYVLLFGEKKNSFKDLFSFSNKLPFIGYKILLPIILFFILVFFYDKIENKIPKKVTSLLLFLLFFCFIFIFGVVIDNSDQSLIQIFSNGFDLFFTTLAKLFTPWKTLVNSLEVNVPFYKTVFALGSISVSYLVYQLIVALRRKIRR